MQKQRMSTRFDRGSVASEPASRSVKGRLRGWPERPSPFLLSDLIEASRKGALFLAKNHNLCHAFFQSPGEPGSWQARNEENVAQRRFRQLVYYLRWRPEIFFI